jgi:hypothetical protein
MAHIWGKSDLTTLRTSIRRSPTFQAHVARIPSANIESASAPSQAPPFRPFTTHIIAVITESAQLKTEISTATPTSIQSPVQTTPHLPTSSISASVTHFSPNVNATFTSFASQSTSSRQSVTNVGTVVSESELPKAWQAKDVGQPESHRIIFWVVIVSMFVLTMVGIVAIGQA